MKLKLLALSLLLAAGVMASLIQASPVIAPGLADGVSLLPDQIGDFRRSGPHWRNTIGEGRIEEGSLYTVSPAPTAAQLPVQLDYYRRSTRAHNGLGCYLAQGETLRWERQQSVLTATGPVDFLVALTQTREAIRLVATTECLAYGCSEKAISDQLILTGLERTALVRLMTGHGDKAAENSGVVPLSVVLTVPDNGSNIALTQDTLLKQFSVFAAGLDLAPARQVAALQGGINIKTALRDGTRVGGHI